MSMNDKSDSRLDSIDLRILEALTADGRLPLTDLAKRVGLSRTPCQNRIKRLQADGYITGFRAVIDPEKLGRNHIAFVEVKLTDTTERALKAFNLAVNDVAEIEQCHMIAGAFDYLLKVRTQDIVSYRAVLGEQISALPHVGSTSTHVSMQSVKDEM